MAKRPSAVLRNTLILVGGQLAGVPLSVALNAAMGRYLGATDFGYIYLAVTLTGFGFLLVEWGHGSVIAAAVARDTTRAGSLVGTSLLWRLSTSLLVSGVLWLLSIILGYTAAFRWVLLFQLITAILAAVRNTYLDAVRGFERLEFSAYAQLATQLLSVALIIPGLALGGQLTTVLLLQVACNLLVSIAVWRAWRSIGRQPLRFDRGALKELFGHGSSFLIFGFAMALQPNVDAIFLSKLTSPTVLGWQAAAQRLQGLIIMPVAALGSALYPTLSRLYVEDRAEYNATVSRSLRGTALLAIPAALGCALYRTVGVRMFGRASFEHVEQNLLVLSSLVFLLYFSMPVGVAILAAGRQRPFAMVQCVCIVVSVALDPLLIPWFDQHYGNGGLGVCVANAVSEILVLAAAIPLLPRGIGMRALAKSIGKGLVAAAAMAGVAFALGGITPYVAAPIAGLTYFACLWLIGGIETEHIEAIRGLVARKLARRQQQA